MLLVKRQANSHSLPPTSSKRSPVRCTAVARQQHRKPSGFTAENLKLSKKTLAKHLVDRDKMLRPSYRRTAGLPFLRETVVRVSPLCLSHPASYFTSTVTRIQGWMQHSK